MPISLKNRIKAAADADRRTMANWCVIELEKSVEASERIHGQTIHPMPAPSNLFRDATKMVHVPFWGTVAAGVPGGPLDCMDGTISVPADCLGKSKLESVYVLRVNGQSMEPDFPDGSHILCRKLNSGEFAKKGNLVIAADGAGAYFKRLIYSKDGKKGDSPRKAIPHLVSINPDFPEVVPLSDCPIVAVVIGRID